MLIYDHNKHFIGIDEDDLKQLGFNTAASLFEYCNDFAELFVKRPGYIHNFKNFAWIDFVLHAEAEDSKAIIHTPKRNFSCVLSIKPFHLVGASDQDAFAIYLQNMRPLNDEQNAQIAHDISTHPTPIIGDTSVKHHTATSESALPNFDNMPAHELSEPDIFDVPLESAHTYHPDSKESFNLDIDDAIEPATFQADSSPKTPLPLIEDQDKASDLNTHKRSNLPDIPMLGDKLSSSDQEYINNLQIDPNYRYNPQIAADELGLPVDLIEEFIGDFIQQAHDFHDPLFDACNAQDMDNIKTLSHKLKGVAANLRIEDAFEVLSVINTSHDIDEIFANLKHFYFLLAKLEGKEPEATANKNTFNNTPAEVAITDDVIADEDVTQEENEIASSELDDIYALGIATTKDNEELFDIPQQPLALDEQSKEEDDDDMIIALKEEDEGVFLVVEDEDNPKDESLKSEPKRPMLNIDEDENKTDFVADSFEEMDEEDDKLSLLDIVDDAEITHQFDSLKVANELGLSKELVETLVSDFKHESENQVKALKEAVNAFDSPRWQRLAKELKGISDNLRCTEISYQLQTLSTTNDAQQAKTSLEIFAKLIDQL